MRVPFHRGICTVKRARPARHGFVLPAVLLALLLIAALIAGAFRATTEETRMSAAAAERQRALVAAESALEMTVGALAAGSDVPPNVSETTFRRIEGLAVPTIAYVTRLDSSVYWIVAASGGDTGSGITRRIGVLVKATKAGGDSIAIDRISERAWSEVF